VTSRVVLARDDLRTVAAGPGADRDGLAEVAALLDAAQAAASRPGSGLRLWLDGSAINRAFVSLHAAQVLLARLTPADRVDVHLLSAMARLRSTMPATAQRRQALERQYAAATAAHPPATTDVVAVKRWVLEKALEWSYAATDAQYARLRNFRTIIAGVSLAVLLLVVALAALGAVWPATFGLCFIGDGSGTVCPTGGSPARHDAFVVAVLGAAGGALAGVLAVRTMQGTATPYGVPLTLALLKLPFGALTALLGLVLVHGRFVPGLANLDTSGQILAYAIALGVAQQAVTALVDRRGQELLAGMPYKPTGRSPDTAPNSTPDLTSAPAPDHTPPARASQPGVPGLAPAG
jgi:hypothetical protein